MNFCQMAVIKNGLSQGPLFWEGFFSSCQWKPGALELDFGSSIPDQLRPLIGISADRLISGYDIAGGKTKSPAARTALLYTRRSAR